MYADINNPEVNKGVDRLSKVAGKLSERCGKVLASPTGLADGGEDFAGHPFLHGESCGLVRTTKEEVEALFGQDDKFLIPRRGRNRSDPSPLVGHMQDRLLSTPAIPKYRANILGNEPRLTVENDGADFSSPEVG